MKKIAAAVGLVFFLLLAPAYGGQTADADENPRFLPEAEIEAAESDAGTIFTIPGSTRQDKKASAAPYLTRYYLEKGGFREVLISCFLPFETVFPSEEYSAASKQVHEIYNAFADKGISEDYLFISVRFEKNIPAEGMITVEFLAHAGYFQRVGRNFINGITDIVSSPLELPKGMLDESRKNGAMAGVPRGVFSGFGQALRKAGTGTIKLLTFWAG